jgi:hypothetical protein
MNNLMLMARRGDMTMGDFDPSGATRPRVVGSLPTMTPPGRPSTGEIILGGVTAGLQAITTIFAARNNPGIYTGQQTQGQLTPQQIYAIQQAQLQQQALVTGGVTNQGIQIGGSQISWPVIALAVGAIMLVQSRGFSRR